MEDWEDESPSDDDDINNIENELYSMFYYHSVSEGIPKDLAEKYDVDINNFGVTISLKGSTGSNDYCSEKNDLISNKVDGVSSSTEECQRRTNDRYIDGRSGNKEVLLEIPPDIPENLIDESTENSSEDPQFHLDQSPTNIKSSLANIKPKDVHSELNNSSSKDLDKSFKRTPRYFDNTKPIISKTQSTKFSGKQLLQDKSLKGNLESHIKLPEVSSNIKKSHNSKWNKINNKIKGKEKINGYKKTNEKECDYVDLTEDIDDNNSTINQNKLRRNKTKIKLKETVITISSDSESSYESSENSEVDSESNLGYDSDDNSLASIVLNTLSPSFDDSCIIDINTDYDWRKTSSPEGWTKSMRRFYNKPSKELSQFDYNAFLKDTKNVNVEWRICQADRYRFNRKRQIRCIRCNEEGHVKAKCTKVFSCFMCGITGHKAKNCPRKICLKCGSQRKDRFISGCNNCKNEDHIDCNFCGVKGHSSSMCTEVWRSFRYEEEDLSVQSLGQKYCCNCAKSGHTFDDCKKKFNFRDVIPIKKGNRNVLPRKLMFRGQHKRKFSESNHFDCRTNLPMNNKRGKFKLHPTTLDFRKIRVSKFLINEKNKKRNVSKRIHMLRKSNKKKFKPLC